MREATLIMQQTDTAQKVQGSIFRRASLALGIIGILAAGIFGLARGVNAAPRIARPLPGAFSVTLPQMQQMIFVWASGTPAVQTLARQQCAAQGLSAAGCAQVSAAVRAAWLELMARDPAAVGRLYVHPNLPARTQILQTLAGRLTRVSHLHLPMLLGATASTFQQINKPQWVEQNFVKRAWPILMSGYATVWATAYEQTALPPGMTATGSPYAALPDAYLSMANTGRGADIPAIYQPYYLPTAGAHWSVGIVTTSHNAGNIPITDVGPWNEDDNWWDPNATSATLPAACPASATLHAPDATSNPLVNGICPNGRILRRLYYYLLYQHSGLPFFQSAAYAPSGTFADGTAWPSAMPYRCAETAAASLNNDHITCAGSMPSAYNGNHGAWLRDGTNDAPILNQSSIDLSPAVDAALGWTYPSSGLVLVNVGFLP
jgi:hypothetical protein